MAKKPVIYFVFRINEGPTSTRFGGFVSRLKKTGFMPDAEYKTVALSDLSFVIDENNFASIYDKQGEKQFHDASFVYFKSWEGMPEIASMVVSYLRSQGVPYEDKAVSHTSVGKASQLWKLWSQGVAVIPTIVTSGYLDQSMMQEAIGVGPYLIKPVDGQKGEGIVVLDSLEEVKQAIAADPTGWVIQPFIPNEGDYRVLCYGYEVRGAMYRQAAKGMIVNNTSQGGTSSYVEPETIPTDIAKLAVKAANAVQYAVAGVDVLVDAAGKAHVLEVNQGSQIVTGHHVNKKMAAFAGFISERIVDRFGRRQPNNQLAFIGRNVYVNLPELGVKRVFAKVDTGAYQSSIHATNIREVKTKDGVALEFTILEGHSATEGHEVKPTRVREYKKVDIRSSFGTMQTRYVIRTRISINGRMIKTGLTLSDRKDMIAPILLGRRFLRGRYIVNVEMGAKGVFEDDLG